MEHIEKYTSKTWEVNGLMENILKSIELYLIHDPDTLITTLEKMRNKIKETV